MSLEEVIHSEHFDLDLEHMSYLSPTFEDPSLSSYLQYYIPNFIEDYRNFLDFAFLAIAYIYVGHTFGRALIDVMRRRKITKKKY